MPHKEKLVKGSVRNDLDPSRKKELTALSAGRRLLAAKIPRARPGTIRLCVSLLHQKHGTPKWKGMGAP